MEWGEILRYFAKEFGYLPRQTMSLTLGQAHMLLPVSEDDSVTTSQSEFDAVIAYMNNQNKEK